MKLVKALAHFSSILSAAVLITACGGGGGGATPPGTNPGTPPPATYTVGGTISGLAATGLQLNLASGSVNESHSPDSGASGFTFAAELEDDDAYTVTIAQQPTGQTCSLDSASGTISGANVALTLSCSVNLLTVSGSVSGLTQGQLTLVLNKGESSTQSIVLDTGDVSFDSTFEFANKVAYGSSFSLDVEYPALHANQPKAICDVDTGSGVVGVVDVESLNLVCRSLGNAVTLDAGADSPLVSLNVDMNDSGNAAASWLDLDPDGLGSNYRYSPYIDSWATPYNFAADTGAFSGAQRSSVIMDDNLHVSLLFFDYTGTAPDWDAQLTQNLVGSSQVFGTNNSTTSASVMAFDEVTISGERVKIVAVDNNDPIKPICIYTQKGASFITKNLCIDLPAGTQEEVMSAAIAVHVKADDSAVAAVVWEQEGIESGQTVSRLYGAIADLASTTDGVGQVLDEPFDTPLTPPFVYTSPVLESVSIDSDIRFVLSYELKGSVVFLESLTETLEQTFEAKQFVGDPDDTLDVVNAVRAPRLSRVGDRDVMWTYLVEDVVDEGVNKDILIDSAIFSRRARFQEGQSKKFSFSNDDFNVFTSDLLGDLTQDGYLISHHDLAVDHEGNALVAFRESLRGPSADPLSLIPGVGVEKETIRLMVIPEAGTPFSLTNSDRGEVDTQLYDTDPNTTNDSAPLMFLRSDKVLDIDVNSRGEATLLWSIWDVTNNDDNSVKAVRLELP